MSVLLSQMQRVLAAWDASDFSGPDGGDEADEEDDYLNAGESRLAMKTVGSTRGDAAASSASSAASSSVEAPLQLREADILATSLQDNPADQQSNASCREVGEMPETQRMELPTPLATHRSQLALRRGPLTASLPHSNNLSAAAHAKAGASSNSSTASAMNVPGDGSCVPESAIPVNMFSNEFTSGGGGGASQSECLSKSGRHHRRRFSRNTRAALHRVELARAALALFTSNAGAYRPLLQKVLTFVFGYLDFLVEERSSVLLAGAAAFGPHSRVSAQPRSSSTTSRREERGGGQGRGDSDSVGAAGEGGTDSDAVANAFHKVRLVEARMAALAEDASAQRDRFKAQIAIQQEQQQKLEGLLRHQMEMNHVLVNRPLNMHEEEEQGLELDDTARAANMTGAELETFAARRRERDARYLKRLIARAEREKVLEELEQQVGELARERGVLSERVLKLQKLNSRYARQAVELAARLSVVHDHNIGLAADAQLYQRDAVKDRQRCEKLERDLAVARNMLLTLLEVRAREMVLGGPGLAAAGNDSSHSGGRVMQHQRPNGAVAPREALLLAAADVSGDDKGRERHGVADRGGGAPHGDTDPLDTKGGAETAAAGPRDALCAASASTTASSHEGAGSLSSPASAAATTTTNPSTTSPARMHDRLENSVMSVRDAMLRRKLQEILAVNDAALAGATKSALLSILCINTRDHESSGLPFPSRDRRERHDGDTNRRHVYEAPMATVALLPGEPKDHLWAPPYGHSAAVPRHLRSAACVRLLPFHPLVAESFVHELLTQRQDLIDYQTLEMEAKALLLFSPNTHAAPAKPRGGAVRESERADPLFATLHGGPPPVARMLPLDEFVELFVNIVWLNRSERFLPLLPDTVRAQITKEGASPAVGPGEVDAAAGGQLDALQRQLQYLVHSGRKAPEELLQLPEEGLRLTYSLDAASRRADAGFLSYAYGLATRHLLSEVIFDILWRERAVFLAMCEHVDRQRAAAKAAAQAVLRKAAAVADPPPTASPAPATPASPDSREVETVTLLGCIPTVQLARVLATMFPSYPVAKLEELVLAAVEDGTDGTQSPVMVYYTVLLPQRLQPGSAAAATAKGDGGTTPAAEQKPPTSDAANVLARSSMPTPTASATAAAFWEEGRFATLFFKSICDDALESLQAVQDSVGEYGRSRASAQALKQPAVQPPQPKLGAAQRGARGAAAPAPSSATASEGGEEKSGGTVNGTPTSATIKQLCTFALQGLSRAEERRWGGAVRAVLQRWPRLLQASRGGAFTTAAAAAAVSSCEETADAGGFNLAAVVSANVASTQVAVADVMPFLRRHLVLRRGPYPRAQSRRAEGTQNETDPPAASDDPMVPLDAAVRHDEEDGKSWWAAPQRDYIASLQSRWDQFVTRGEVVLPDDVSFFYSCLRRADPARTLPWATDAVGEDARKVLRCPRHEVDVAAAGGESATTWQLSQSQPSQPASESAASPLHKGGRRPEGAAADAAGSPSPRLTPSPPAEGRSTGTRPSLRQRDA